MILVDSNVPMYLVGRPHAHKVDAQRALESLLADGEKLVTDAEVFQEILHRYVAIRRADAIQPAFDALTAVVDDVFAIEVADVVAAKTIVLGTPSLSARDALHVAVMRRYRIDRILSFDVGFDGLPGVERVF